MFNGKKGVYLIMQGLRPMYVGRSNNIGRRLRQHVRDGTDAGRLLDRGWFVTVWRISPFESSEVFLIKLLNPKLNKQHNPNRKNRVR